MIHCILFIILLLSASGISAQLPPNPDNYYAGIYADQLRVYDCISGPVASGFEQFVWAWIPHDSGLSYITLRFLFPSNVDLSRRPVFNDLMTNLEIVDYGAGGSEWTALFAGCPSGWVWIFSQECVFLDSEESSIRINEPFSLARNCQFAIYDIHLLNNPSLNDADCAIVSVENATWGSIKNLYQHID